MNDSSKFSSLIKQLVGCNLYLVGMMGSGKSHTGPPLAKQLDYGFVDIDVVIEKAAGKSIGRIFDDDGEEEEGGEDGGHDGGDGGQGSGQGSGQDSGQGSGHGEGKEEL